MSHVTSVFCSDSLDHLLQPLSLLPIKVRDTDPLQIKLDNWFTIDDKSTRRRKLNIIKNQDLQD